MARITINKSNYYHNLDLILKQTGSKEKIAVVLKDNAYGHGLENMAKLASEYGIKKAVVKNLTEALKIEEFFEYILILADTETRSYSHTFHIVINSCDEIYELPENTNVHLKIDTGMHRNGIPKSKLKECIYGLFEQNLNLTGIMTHHCCADNLSSNFFIQNLEFGKIKEEVKNICEQLSKPLPAFHSCNSAAVFRKANFDEDFARVGIASYGYLENQKGLDQPALKPVLSLWGKRISTRVLKKNQSVGYGASYISDKEKIISTYDVGYGDGFLRLNEKNEYFTPDGFRVLGKVSMDNLSLDSDKKEVCIFNNAKNLAKIHDTITYEIVTTLSPYIKREIV